LSIARPPLGNLGYGSAIDLFGFALGGARGVFSGGAAGDFVFVSGTVGADGSGRAVGPGAYEQAVKALQRIEAALAEAGAGLADVVRTRICVTDISHWEEVGRAHGEVFGPVRPATSMVEVSRLIAPTLSWRSRRWR